MKNRVIKCLTEAHGKEIIKYWQGQGVDTNGAAGLHTELAKDWSCYYGVINGKFDNYSLPQVTASNTEIFEIPTTDWDALLKIAGEKYPPGTEYNGFSFNGTIQAKTVATILPKIWIEQGIEVGEDLIYHLATNKWAEVASVPEKEVIIVPTVENVKKDSVKEFCETHGITEQNLIDAWLEYMKQALDKVQIDESVEELVKLIYPIPFPDKFSNINQEVHKERVAYIDGYKAGQQNQQLVSKTTTVTLTQFEGEVIINGEKYYSKEEVKKLLYKFNEDFKYQNAIGNYFSKWTEENL